jgi:hypothetical protein
MTRAHAQYIGELQRAFGNYRATWFPNVHLELGTVGTIDDGIFVPRSQLSSFGITFGTRRAPQPQEQFVYQSEGAVKTAFKAKGESNRLFQYIGDADAGIRVDFSRAHAVLFVLRGPYEDRIDDQFGLANQLLELPRSNFPREYIIITHLVSAASGTILIAGSTESSVEIRASASIGNLLDLANVDAGMSIAQMNGMHTQLLASASITPLFRAVRLRERWFSGRRVEPFGEVPLDDVVEDVTYPPFE